MNFYSIDYKGVTEAMKKKVSIYPKTPITSTNPPIRVPIEKVTKEVRDIRRCIIAGAKVFEHLEDGSKVELNLNNYDMNNSNTQQEESEEEAKVEVTEKKASLKTDESNEVEVQDTVDEATEEVVVEENAPVEEEAEVVEEEMPESEPAAQVETPQVEQKQYQHLTKKQRKALRAAQVLPKKEEEQKQQPEEEIETMDVEDVLS